MKRAMTLLTLAVVASLLLTSPALAAPGCDKALEALVAAKMTALGVPGVIVHVDVPGVCEWTATLGTGDVEKREKLNLNSHVRIGSVTKTFTGTVVLQLVDEGQVELDAPIARYLSGVPNGAHITVRQILAMTSGLHNYSELPSFNQSLDADPQRVWAPSELIALGLNGPVYFPPGQGFHYSNTNSALLGRLIEVKTKMSYAEAVTQRIFRTLRMNGSSVPRQDDASIPRPHPRGYTYGTNVGTLPPACDAATVGRHDVTHASPSWTWAAGGAISTLHDLKIWTRALAEGALLTSATQAERLKGVPTGPGGPLYGLHITNFFGVIGHDGALPGFSSFVGYVPAKRATLIVLTNLYPAVSCEGPADEIAKILGGKLGLFTLER